MKEMNKREQEKNHIETIDKIIALLPELTIHTSTPKMKKAYVRLQKAIREHEAERMFEQPKSKEEKEYRRFVVDRMKEFRKSGKTIEL